MLLSNIYTEADAFLPSREINESKHNIVECTRTMVATSNRQKCKANIRRLYMKSLLSHAKYMTVGQTTQKGFRGAWLANVILPVLGGALDA